MDHFKLKIISFCKNIFILLVAIIAISTFANKGFPKEIQEIVEVGTPAPEWVVSEWINSSPFTLKELRGKVVVIDFFQLWCPGCNSFLIPLMLRWEEVYKDNPNIQLIGIHTVFEGHDYQTTNRLRRYVKEKGIGHPIAVDSYVSSKRTPETMIRYQTRGTPQIAIIDKEGTIRFEKFGRFDVKEAERLIDQLLRQ